MLESSPKSFTIKYQKDLYKFRIFKSILNELKKTLNQLHNVNNEVQRNKFLKLIKRIIKILVFDKQKFQRLKEKLLK